MFYSGEISEREHITQKAPQYKRRGVVGRRWRRARQRVKDIKVQLVSLGQLQGGGTNQLRSHLILLYDVIHLQQIKKVRKQQAGSSPDCQVLKKLHGLPGGERILWDP